MGYKWLPPLPLCKSIFKQLVISMLTALSPWIIHLLCFPPKKTQASFAISPSLFWVVRCNNNSPCIGCAYPTVLLVRSIAVWQSGTADGLLPYVGWGRQPLCCMFVCVCVRVCVCVLCPYLYLSFPIFNLGSFTTTTCMMPTLSIKFESQPHALTHTHAHTHTHTQKHTPQCVWVYHDRFYPLYPLLLLTPFCIIILVCSPSPCELIMLAA